MSPLASVAERKHNHNGKAGGPLGTARGALSFSGPAPFLWRPPQAANENPAPMAKRIRRALRMAMLFGVVGGLIWSAIYFR